MDKQEFTKQTRGERIPGRKNRMCKCHRHIIA